MTKYGYISVDPCSIVNTNSLIVRCKILFNFFNYSNFNMIEDSLYINKYFTILKLRINKKIKNIDFNILQDKIY